MSIETAPTPVDAPSTSALPADTLDFAARIFDLARRGETEMLRQYLDAGLPPNLTNAQGEIHIMCAFNDIS